MSTRIDLQTKLEFLINSENVYYQPPGNLKMEYPCIRYSRSDIDSKKADNINYINTTGYTLVVIDKNPDSAIIGKILDAFSIVSYDRHYISDNLNHDVIKIYY